MIAPGDGTTSWENTKKLLYRVCDVDGVITVKNSSGSIVRTLDVRTAFLPEEDQKALRDGIEIFSESCYYKS